MIILFRKIILLLIFICAGVSTMKNIQVEELKKIASSGYGRGHADRLVDILKQRPDFFDNMVSIYLANEEPVSRRAAWALDLYTEAHPELLIPIIELIVSHLPTFEHDGMKRHSLRMLARSPLPKENSGQLISQAFNFLLSPVETPAVKVHAMEILYNASLVEPDIRQELIDSIEWRFQEESAGVRSRGEKILKRLYNDIG